MGSPLNIPLPWLLTGPLVKCSSILIVKLSQHTSSGFRCSLPPTVSPEDAKLVPTLLTVVGSKHYSLIRGLVSPALPKDKSYEDLVTLLKKHYDPEPLVIAERFHFYERSQKPGESVADYLASLRRLASRCQFGAFLAEALRDRLVCGLLSENIQKVLLTKADLTLEKALETAQGMEAAAQKSQELKGSHRSNAVLAVDTPVPGRICDRCGR